LGEERLRSEARRGTIVVVGVRNIVRVELDLVVVEVEVRSLAELTIAIIGVLPLSINSTGGRGLLFFKKLISSFKPPEFYSTASLLKKKTRHR